MQLVNKVEEWLEEKPMAEILKKAFQTLDVNSLMTKCRFAFAMKKSDFIITEKTFRKGRSLSAFIFFFTSSYIYCLTDILLCNL